jgi:hypothetical protein
VTEHLLSILKAVGLIPRTTKKKKKKERSFHGEWKGYAKNQNIQVSIPVLPLAGFKPTSQDGCLFIQLSVRAILPSSGLLWESAELMDRNERAPDMDGVKSVVDLWLLRCHNMHGHSMIMASQMAIVCTLIKTFKCVFAVITWRPHWFFPKSVVAVPVIPW